MCMLCVVQRWSRRVATMLPWCVIPFIVFWVLSQVLPPALRFEITSPQLACVSVLLASLFWYEVLMPQLSSWRDRRAARLRERRRTEALELQKRRKSATLHCRNCHMPYRNQTPGGGRFMCSYCGHISRKPMLDRPGPTAGPGMITDLVGKHGWSCEADGNCSLIGSVTKHWTGSDHRCLTEIPYSRVMMFSCKLFSFFFSSRRWLFGKFFRLGSSKEDRSSDLDHRVSSKKGEISGNFQETRGEKARRKAEEKRQARLEKEILEEEDRKQKEEVARLVEERRKLRDEKIVAEKDRSKGSTLGGDRDGRKEIDRRRDRRKAKDKASCKSNSDGEELENRTSKQNDRKNEFLKKGENERFGLQKSMGDNYKSQALHSVYGSTVMANKPIYFDGMKGNFLSSSRGFGGSSFFGRNAQKSSAVCKSFKPATGFVDHAQNAVKRRDAHPVAYAVGKSASSAGENAYEAKLSQNQATTDVQPKTVFKMPWQPLFSCSSAVSPYPDSNPTTHKTGQLLARGQGDQRSHHSFLPSYSTTIHDQVQFGPASPFMVSPPTSSLLTNNPLSHLMPETTFPPLKEPQQSSVSEDVELFEDPCHVPNLISLLGPVSESLDNFPLDLKAEFVEKTKTEQYPLLERVYASKEVNKPLPVESPSPKIHASKEIHIKSDQLFCTPMSVVSTNRHEQSTWQMWGTPWAQEGQVLVGCPSNLFSPIVHNNSQQHVLNSLPHKPMMPPISKNNNIQHFHPSNHQQNGGIYNLCLSLNGNGIWLQDSPFQSPLRFEGDDHLLPLNLMDDIIQSEATYSSPNKYSAVHSFGTHQANSWTNKYLDSYAPHEAVKLNAGSADRPSVWPFNSTTIVT